MTTPIAEFLTGIPDKPIQWIHKPWTTRYQADPFGVIKDGCLYIFFEKLAHHTLNGEIAVVKVNPDGSVSDPQTVLSLPIHISYPYMFEDDGMIYCIPETNAAREINLYQIENFPASWTYVTTLISEITAVDSTLIQYNGRWWLFCSVQEDGSTNMLHLSSRLSLWYADKLTGPWLPHAGNPVKVDIHSSRPAGTPFLHEGILYRPAQDCAPYYGCRTVIMRINELSPTSFAEEPVAYIDPDSNGPYPDGLHTVSAVGNYTLIDGYRFIAPIGLYPFVMKVWRGIVNRITHRSNPHHKLELI
ncbi:MAG TPA: hypothetical protein VHV83_08530 [Armatimonadota bacterium]|nr:hypothetical protein [Armatimonadota bacterium]